MIWLSDKAVPFDFVWDKTNKAVLSVISHILSLLDKFKVTSEHVLIIGHCPLM